MKQGDIVIFKEASDEQVKWGNNDDPRKVLQFGGQYEVEEVDEHSWHTKVKFARIDGWFNSVHFESINK